MRGRMLNFPSASTDEASVSSNNNRNETVTANNQQQPLASPSNNPAQPAKKKRNLPGNPDPEAQVVALSPRSLLATNKFVCEICNKGFQRDQNLQLHRRGHNLPWKLKQRTNKEVQKKVYICPEPTCVHHDPSRALGDLTGIKKHYSRKHGEKKWKCEKCSKRYAVRSDWKAHSKICGTREYRCDCGTLFSRRDNFVTHRAFCDALAEESARAITANPLLQASQACSSATTNLNFQTQLHSHGLQAFPIKREQELQQSFHLRPETMPQWLASTGQEAAGPSDHLCSQLFTSRLDHPIIHHQENPNPNPTLSSFHPILSHNSPHMSATALLQKAEQMGVSMSKAAHHQPETIHRPHQGHMINANGLNSTSLATPTAGSSCLGLSAREEIGTDHGIIHDLASYGNKAVISSSTSAGCMQQIDSIAKAGGAPPLLHPDTMSSFPSSTSRFQESASFEETLNGLLNPKSTDDDRSNFHEALTHSSSAGSNLSRGREGGGGGGGGGGAGGQGGLTRDFLGLRAFPQRGFLNMAGFDHIGSSSSSSNNQQNHNPPPPWQS